MIRCSNENRIKHIDTFTIINIRSPIFDQKISNRTKLSTFFTLRFANVENGKLGKCDAMQCLSNCQGEGEMNAEKDAKQRERMRKRAKDGLQKVQEWAE